MELTPLLEEDPFTQADGCPYRTRGSYRTMVEELEQEYEALRDKVRDLQEYL